MGQGSWHLGHYPTLICRTFTHNSIYLGHSIAPQTHQNQVVLPQFWAVSRCLQCGTESPQGIYRAQCMVKAERGYFNAKWPVDISAVNDHGYVIIDNREREKRASRCRPIHENNIILYKHAHSKVHAKHHLITSSHAILKTFYVRYTFSFSVHLITACQEVHELWS